MPDPFDLTAGWVEQHALVPLLYRLGWMRWEDLSYGWALFAVYGAVQVAFTFAICVPLERWRPLERWPDRHAVGVDIASTVISRVGVLPLVTFVAFYQAQVELNGWMTDRGWVPPTLEGLFPFLLGRQVLTFFLYAVILDCADYWRHRLSHMIRWWYAVHSLHHAQRQITFWSDDRNHVLDDLIAFFWFLAIGLMIGIPPMQFPLAGVIAAFHRKPITRQRPAELWMEGVTGWWYSPEFHRTTPRHPCCGATEQQLRCRPPLVGRAASRRQLWWMTSRPRGTLAPGRRWRREAI